MRRLLERLVPVYLALTAAFSARAQDAKPQPALIDGVVRDSSLVPIAAAEVAIVGTSVHVQTGDNGRFQIRNVPAGQYLIIVKHLGFHPTSGVVEVTAGDTLRLAYELARASVTLDTVNVVEIRQSWRELEARDRAKHGQGEFMFQDEIDRKSPAFATELLRNFKSISVTAVSSRSGIPANYAISNRGGGFSACPTRIYLDEVPLPTPFNLDLLPSPKEIAAIEVYGGAATVPPKFQSFDKSFCGVILIWTR